jgi:hypothetical protein
MIRSDSTKLYYRAHDKVHGWLSEISGYDMNDANNGYAGWTGYEIDAIMIRADDIVTTTVIEKPKVEAPKEQIYRVRKSWGDSKSQVGAYKKLQSAIDLCDRVTLDNGEIYHVYDVDGNVVYSGKLPENVPAIEPEIKVETQPEVIPETEVEVIPPVVEPEVEPEVEKEPEPEVETPPVEDEPKEEAIEEPEDDNSVIEPEEPKKGFVDLIKQLLISIAKVIKSIFKF